MALSRTRAALCLTVAALAVPALASPGVSAPATSEERPAVAQRAARASFDYTPRTFVGGQRLTFSGHIGVRGRRTLRLQVHMNRPGDVWNTVDGFTRKTRANGTFNFTYRAPSMRDKSMRVVAKGGLRTPSQRFDSRAQDLEISAPSVVEPGEAFTVEVDTTAEPAGADVLASPVFPGRTVTLQQRVTTPVLGYADTWVAVPGAAAETNSRGTAVISVPGGISQDTVLRARQEDWTSNGDQVGWYPSHPLTVAVGGQGAAARAGVVRSSSTVARVAAREGGGEGGSSSAGGRYGWRADFDFGWAYGESLDTPPHRGFQAYGTWLETTDGTGRVAPINGQLSIQSARAERRQESSRGATLATLQGNAARYRRWEVRIRARSVNRGLADDVTRIELVPAASSAYDCGGNTITVAEFTPSSDRVRIGARKGGTEWSKRVDVGRLDNDNHAFAVEVGKDHLTWFREGQPIGTVGKAAVPSGPMTLRLSTGDEGGPRRNITQVYYDWMRAYPLGIGKQVRQGGSLTSGPWSGGC